MTPRGTENNAYAKFWGDKQRALWYVMVFSPPDNRALWYGASRFCVHFFALNTITYHKALCLPPQNFA